MAEIAPPGFKERLQFYLEDISRQGSEAGKAYLFLEFLRDIFKEININYLRNLYPELEKNIKYSSKTLAVKGRADAFLGNLIIEFKQTLDSKSLEDARAELRRYVAILWSEQRKDRVQYLLLTTDGLQFIIYRPRTNVSLQDEVSPEKALLDEIDRINLSKTRIGDAFLWLDRYMLYHTLRPLTTEEFSAEFGLDRPAYREAFQLLKDAWLQVKEITMYDQWASFLRIVYGSRVDSEELFIKHTYLSMLAKLVAYASLSGGALPVSDEQIIEILDGRVFSEKWGVHNFLEEDFFSWTAKHIYGLDATRMLLSRLSEYDMSKLDEDILKWLYQELVDPVARHDLGEYYTPDWLAEYIVDTIAQEKDRVKGSFLDPACGSGTFLAAIIRKKKEVLSKDMEKRELLSHILENVQGVDVHPLAVTLARATYIASLGTDLLQAREGPIAIPIYMADSIRPPEEHTELVEEVEAFKIVADGKSLQLPRRVALNPELADASVESIKRFAQLIVQTQKSSKEIFQSFILLDARLARLIGEKDGTVVAEMLYNTAEVMSELIASKRDTIWAFILKNIYKPIFLRRRKFDTLIGNPPWLAYRYVDSIDYQRYLKQLMLTEHVLLPSSKAELMTHIELATVFFAACSSAYLKENGITAFVMPRSVFVADQHDNFRSGLFKPQMQLKTLIDLEEVEPLFNVPSSVVIGAIGGKTSYPVTGEKVRGKLSKKNARLIEAKTTLEFSPTKFYIYRLGERSFLENEDFGYIMKELEGGVRSHYYKLFRQGATVVPSQFWLVEPVKHPIFGFNPKLPNLKTSRRAIKRAKKEYEGVTLQGQVESQFLYSVVTGSELVPFGCMELPLAVLPVEPTGNNYRIINAEEANRRGFLNLQNWLKNAEAIWCKIRGEKAEIMNVYQWLNYANKLTYQNPKASFKLLYNTSGTYLVACVIQNKPILPVVDGQTIESCGVIAGHTTYYYDTNCEEEAFYLTAYLNSPIVDRLIKPMQAKGLFGERHIVKKVLELPIPKYDPESNIHKTLVELGRNCSKKVSELIPELAKYRSIGKIRAIVKENLSTELAQIDMLVKKLLVPKTNRKDLDAFFKP